MERPSSRFPEQLPIGTEKEGRYVRLSDHFAVRGELPDGVAASPVDRLEAEDITICRGDATARPDLAPGSMCPVYELSVGGGPPGGGPLAVPTGEVFVRLAADARVEDHRDAFEAAGYEVSKTLSYAPNAAWLRPRSGDAADALHHIPGLEALPEVENVEPQMLSARALRDP